MPRSEIASAPSGTAGRTGAGGGTVFVAHAAANSEASSARLVADAHLAALAIEHGLTLCSADGDFARFKGLRWENPLS